MTKYRASIDLRFLTKVDRIFDAAPRTVWNELLQNARRAGATEVRVRVDKLKPDGAGHRISFRDNGHGVETPEPLLYLAAEGWGAKIEEYEDPAGMGFFCLSNFPEVEVASRNWAARFTPEVFQGIVELETVDNLPMVHGTSIRWNWGVKDRQELVGPLHDAVLYCGIEKVILERDPDLLDNSDGEVLKVEGFLDICIQKSYPEQVGYAIGIAAKQRDGSHVSSFGYPNILLNFMGVQLDLRYSHDPELQHISDITGAGVNVRVDVYSTSHLRLVLPARNAIKHNDARSAMIHEIERSILTYIAEHNNGRHELPYKVYERAKEVFGIDIGEASHSMKRWSSTYYSTYSDIHNAVVVSDDISGCRALRILWDHARYNQGKLHFVACRANRNMVGYSWYDALPRITEVGIRVNGEHLGDLEEVFDSDQDKQRERAGIESAELFQLVDSIQLIFKLTKGVADIVVEPEVLIRGDGNWSCWEDIAQDECWFQVLGRCVKDREMLSSVNNLIHEVVFQSDSSGDDYTSAEEQECQFETALWRNLLKLAGAEMEGARYELERQLDSFAYNLRDEGFVWSVSLDGSESAPKVDYLMTGEQYDTGCNVLVACQPRNKAGLLFHVVSQTPVTRERMAYYFDVGIGGGFDPEEDTMIIQPPGPIVDLDAWEAERGIQ